MTYEQNGGDMKIVFRVIGIDCRHCAEIIEQTLVRIEGIREARIDVHKGRLFLTCDEYQVCQATDEAKKLVEKMEHGASIEKLVNVMM